jgi:pyroglutamyl-peptidase
MERQSPREPYWEKKDVRGEVFSREQTSKVWPASKYPAILKSTFDTEDVWRRWRDNVSDSLDVRPSDDPGNYLCGFIYYCSMAWYWGKQSKERPVMFLHVPDLPTEEQVDGGREVAVGLIRALVESRKKKGVSDPLKGIVSEVKLLDQAVDVAQKQEKSDQTAAAVDDDDMAWTYRQ